MESSNSEMLVLLKNLSDRFDSLQRDVDSVKEKETCRSAGELEAEPSQSPGPRRVAAPGTQQDRTREKERRPKSSTRRQRHSSASDNSRSRSRSLKEKSSRRKGKFPALRTSKQRSSRPFRSWADRMSDSEDERMDYTRPIWFSDSEAEDRPPSKLIEVSEKTEKLLLEKCTWRVTNTVRKELRDPYSIPSSQGPSNWNPTAGPLYETRGFIID